jgi:hypothetical protein
MLGEDVLMARALRYSVDINNLTIDALKTIPGPLKNKLMDLSIEIAEDMRYHQLKYFRPFKHQTEFFKTGSSERRGILAANRIGKTVSTCF